MVWSLRNAIESLNPNPNLDKCEWKPTTPRLQVVPIYASAACDVLPVDARDKPPTRFAYLASRSTLATDQQRSVPNSCLDYFNGVKVGTADDLETPDEEFFNGRVLTQVRGKTYWRTWKDEYLSKDQLINMPFFMCGGGMRMPYYKALESKLAVMAGFPWLKAECWQMGVPDDLLAKHISADNYDRLSVAYGLSRLEVGKIIKALPRPKLTIPPVQTWRDNYRDKDQC